MDVIFVKCFLGVPIVVPLARLDGALRASSLPSVDLTIVGLFYRFLSCCWACVPCPAEFPTRSAGFLCALLFSVSRFLLFSSRPVSRPSLSGFFSINVLETGVEHIIVVIL